MVSSLVNDESLTKFGYLLICASSYVDYICIILRTFCEVIQVFMYPFEHELGWTGRLPSGTSLLCIIA
jgi:hypothetical protein